MRTGLNIQTDDVTGGILPDSHKKTFHEKNITGTEFAEKRLSR